mmetsp:Transcript_21978/g.63887  ORF Transcript_21978/g.63887 Transcript_21978/m.63887 type:complete len:110 (+) Transcript_21978:45-374(+)
MDRDTILDAAVRCTLDKASPEFLDTCTRMSADHWNVRHERRGGAFPSCRKSHEILASECNAAGKLLWGEEVSLGQHELVLHSALVQEPEQVSVFAAHSAACVDKDAAAC